MVIAALAAFGTLLAAWLLAPAEGRSERRSTRRAVADVAPALAEAA